MTTRKLVSLVLVAMVIASCAEAFGSRTGRDESLVVELDTAEQVLFAELDRVFGDYTVIAEGEFVGRCEPLEMYSGAHSVTIEVDGVDQHAAFDMYIAGRRGLHEHSSAESPSRSAGFDVDGIGGQMAVFDQAGAGGLRVAANTGCYGEESWGVDDPLTLNWGER
jgi:hypothetical protein